MPKKHSGRPAYWTVFTDKTLWEAFFADLDNAKFRVIIHTPFLALHRLQQYWHRFRELRRRGVVVCIFLEEPSPTTNGQDAKSAMPQGFQALVTELQSMDVHVTLKPAIHEKLAVIDETVFWEGSLNYLSHRRTSDRINRIANREILREGIAMHGLDRCKTCQQNREKNFAAGNSEALSRGLRTHRKVTGLNQRELAALCNTTQSAVSKAESGEHSNVTLEAFCELAAKSYARPVLVPEVLLPQVVDLLNRWSESTKMTG
jgi:hypothetical protein